MAKKKRPSRTKALRRNLEENIVSRGMDSPVFRERVEDYLFFFERLDEFKEDIEENGLTETDRDGNIVPRKVISESLKVSRELGKIYHELGLDMEAKTKRAPDGDEEL